jgi:hypothetical protein
VPVVFAISLNPIDWLTDAAGGVAGGAADAVFNFFLDLVLEALDWLARQIAGFFVSAGAPTFGAGATNVSSLMVYVALVVAIGGAMLQAGITAVRPNASSTSALVDLPVTVVALGSIYAIAAVWLGFTDAVAKVVLTDAVRQSFGGGMQMDLAIVPFMRLLLALFMLLFMILLFVEQLIRAHLLAVLIVMLPIGVAARVWEPARYLTTAMVKIFVALSITPILTGVSMSIALANFDSAGPLDFVRMLGALAGIAVTTLMPFMVFKLFPIGAEGTGGAGLAAVGGAVGAAKIGSQAGSKFGSASRDSTAAAGAKGSAAAAGPAGMAAASLKETARTATRAVVDGAREATESGNGSSGRRNGSAGTPSASGPGTARRGTGGQRDGHGGVGPTREPQESRSSGRVNELTTEEKESRQ